MKSNLASGSPPKRPPLQTIVLLRGLLSKTKYEENIRSIRNHEFDK